MKNPIQQLEARLQALIEGSIARLFPIVNRQENLAGHLVDAMRANIHPQEDGNIWAPNLFTLAVHPAQAQILEARPEILEGLEQILQLAGGEAGLQFPSAPDILVEADPDMSLHEMRIVARFDLDLATGTSVLEKRAVEHPTASSGGGAYLIIDGTRIFPLTGGVINIGRSSSNDIVVNDPRVSRKHAQLREVQGRYTIFDLDSTSGTFVNQQRVKQIALYPGDVITLADVPLVYGQDPAGVSGETQEMPFSEG